jgi:7-cyano-7-deazaguanine synthase
LTQSGKALVLFSGGQDSATCLAWALDRFSAVETIGFAYGQRHAVELEVRGAFMARLRSAFPAWAGRLGEDHMLDLSVIGLMGQTALTADVEIEMGRNNLPTTFVPGRNILFFTSAAAVAYRRDCVTLWAACAKPTTPVIPTAAMTR